MFLLANISFSSLAIFVLVTLAFLFCPPVSLIPRWLFSPGPMVPLVLGSRVCTPIFCLSLCWDQYFGWGCRNDLASSFARFRLRRCSLFLRNTRLPLAQIDLFRPLFWPITRENIDVSTLKYERLLSKVESPQLATKGKEVSISLSPFVIISCLCLNFYILSNDLMYHHRCSLNDHWRLKKK